VVGIEVVAILTGLLLLLAKFMEDLFKRFGLPGFVGSVLAGIALGRAGLDLIDPLEMREILLLISLGISFLLFLAGLEELPTLNLTWLLGEFYSLQQPS